MSLFISLPLDSSQLYFPLPTARDTLFDFPFQFFSLLASSSLQSLHLPAPTSSNIYFHSLLSPFPLLPPLPTSWLLIPLPLTHPSASLPTLLPSCLHFSPLRASIFYLLPPLLSPAYTSPLAASLFLFLISLLSPLSPFLTLLHAASSPFLPPLPPPDSTAPLSCLVPCYISVKYMLTDAKTGGNQTFHFFPFFPPSVTPSAFYKEDIK